MSLLKNIWRPDEPPRKGPNPHGDSVLTERLAELLGRELEELQESAATEPRDLAPAAPTEQEENEGQFAARETRADADLAMDLEAEDPQATTTALRSETNAKTLPANGDAGTARIAEATAEALAQLRAAHVEIEASLRHRVDDYGRALEAAIGGLAHETGTPEKPIEEATQQFRSEAREWFEEARRELREQLEMSRISLENQLRAHHSQLLQSAQQQIESLAHSPAESDTQVSQQASQERVERWLKEQGELSRQQTEAGARELKQATEQAMVRLQAVEERITASFREQVEEYRKAVEAAAAELDQKGISQANFQNAAEELQRMTDQILDRSAKRIEERTEQAVNRLSEKLSAAEQSLGAAARAAMQGALEEQQQRMAEAWHERSQAAVESVALAGEQSRAQIEEARRAAEGEFQNAAREQSRRLLEQVSTELQSSEFRERTLGDVRKQMEQAARELVARSTVELGKQSELATSRLTNNLDKAAEKYLSQVQQHMEALGPAWLEAAGQTVLQDYQARISQWLEQQTELTRQRAAAAGQTVEQAFQQATSRLETVGREVEATLRGRLQEQQQQWLDSALEEAHKSGFERKMIEQAIAELGKNSKQFLEQSTRELTEQATALRETITREMDVAGRKLLEGVEGSLENISWQHRGRLAQWWEERSQTARREAETLSQSMAQAAQQAASQLRTVQNEIEAEMKNRARDQQAHLLEAAMEEMRRSGAIERMVNEVSLTLRTNANEVINRSTEQIHDHVETARMAIDNQAQAARRSLAEELARKVEQAQSSVEEAGKALTDDYRRQLSVWWEERAQSSRRESEEAVQTVSRSASRASEQLQAIQKQITTELQSGMENYRKGLRQAAADELRRQGFQRDMLETITAELEKNVREMAERSTRELQRHMDEGLSSLNEKLQGSRQAFLDDSQKKMDDLTRSSLDMATKRFHELLTKNAQELESEQEEWLQRKREAVWLDINKHMPAATGAHHGSSERSKASGGKAASGGVLGRLVMTVAVIAVAAVLTVVFVRLAPPPTTVMQLKNDPPAGFIYENPAWSAPEQAQQLQLGQAYWMVAVNNLEHRYPYKTALPAVPPPDFRVDQNGLQGDPAARMRYWNELRNVWLTPKDWEQTTASNGNLLTQAINWVRVELANAQGKTKGTSGS